MFTCNFTTKFKRDYKRVLKRGWDMNLFENVYDLLAEKGELPQNYKSHGLTGNWIGYIDAHIQPNWVLIYKINKSDWSIDFVRMGTHADLF